MKALTKIKVVLIIKLITPLQPPLTDLKKKLFSYLETAW